MSGDHGGVEIRSVLNDDFTWVVAGRDGDGAAIEATCGGIGDHSSVNPGILYRFADYNPGAGRFDLRPTPLSPAWEAGDADRAPPLDIEGGHACPRSTSAQMRGEPHTAREA